MSANDAEPGDVYIDADGLIWRVLSKCPEPSITMECLEKGPTNKDRPTRQTGGISGLMWEGFRRIYRRD